MPAQDPSEQFVHDYCTKSFFSLWSYLNPLCEDGSELCDILISFGDNIIIISVKDITFNEEANFHVAAERWKKRAVEKSIKQIFGAERHLLNKGSFKVKATPDGDLIEIKDINKLHLHRVSVSLGANGRIPVSSDRQDQKFVHVFTEESFRILFTEFDTIGDFVDYLAAREDFLLNRCQGLSFHSEGDLIMLYINGHRQFPDYSEKTMVYLHDAGYEEFIQSSKYKLKKEADESSYVVDEIINDFIKYNNTGTLVLKSSLDGLEMSLAELASEKRFARRGLGRSILDVAMATPPPGEYFARAYAGSPEDGNLEKIYVIVAVPRELTRQQRYAMLEKRCHVALGLFRDRLDRLLAIGIATELHDRIGTHSYDLLYYLQEQWSDDAQEHMDRLRCEEGIWANSNVTKVQEDEYPVQGHE